MFFGYFFASLKAKLNLLLKRMDTIVATLDNLEADVKAQATVIGSAVTLLQGLKAALDAAIASGDMSRVVAVNAQLESQTAALAAAVAANTPTP